MKRLNSVEENPTSKRRQIQLEDKPPSPVSITRRNQDIPSTTSLSNAIRDADQGDFIYNWIPDVETDFDPMDQPPSKRSRSVSSDHRDGRPSGPSEGYGSRSSSRDGRSIAYNATNYETILETKNCYMRSSATGPAEEDIELCKQLLQREVQVPEGTLFQSEYLQRFHDTLRGRSKMRLLVDLHPMLMPAAENQYIRGRQALKNVIDGYNDSWIKTEPIYGPKPQPDHTRGLRWSAFNESQRQKLGVQPQEKSLYIARDEIYFPYLTGEVKSGRQALDIADRQNMHSACVAIRGLVHLSRLAGCVEVLHRRILAFSISHDVELVRIYGYYPEIEGDKTSYYRYDVGQLLIWTGSDPWACYRFVHNVDDLFLPSHTARVMDMLARIPEPQYVSSGFEPGDVIEPQYVSSGFEPGDVIEPQYIPSSEEEPSITGQSVTVRSRALQPEVRAMMQTIQQQVERLEQEKREQREQFEQERREQKEQEEKLLAQFEQERREGKEREERLLAQLERLAQALSTK
ncbi:hypothetical protein BDV26DRAFT_287645 [Aspergillus bertholletiae]|uniref:DUF7924 domain-containing protein n=1 Tax=Aspergillus bertholletiae TaxID=1226010 RepID=A0A5N7BPN8_9EURO|nr:hypothetical protein BDV26DRAFT_287645 [Aspergillus bertholletiae]